MEKSYKMQQNSNVHNFFPDLHNNPSKFSKILGLYLWKDDSGVMSSKLDLHSGCLNRDFGVMITKGFLKGVAICLLRMWK